MFSDDDEAWKKLKRQLGAASRVTLTERLLPEAYHGVREGFTRAEVAKVASFIVDVCRGDHRKTIAYAKRFENVTEDRIFGRAVRVAVERKLGA